jgi:hypothetical protein
MDQRVSRRRDNPVVRQWAPLLIGVWVVGTVGILVGFVEVDTPSKMAAWQFVQAALAYLAGVRMR